LKGAEWSPENQLKLLAWWVVARLLRIAAPALLAGDEQATHTPCSHENSGNDYCSAHGRFKSEPEQKQEAASKTTKS
jgi:hypothetical protein